MGSRRSPVQGAQVVRAILMAVMAAAVVPPVGAWWLQTRRVDVTTARVLQAAAMVSTASSDGVRCGPGRLPDAGAGGAGPVQAAWLAVAAIDASGAAAWRETDAWGQCLLVGRGWVLSPGANGIIDTPIDATTPAGDDIGVRTK